MLWTHGPRRRRGIRMLAGLAALTLAGCGGDGGAADGTPAAAAASSASDDVSAPAAPKAAEGEVPAWARDDLGCETRGALPGGNGDQVAGIGVGMPLEEVRKLLECHQVAIVNLASVYYNPAHDGTTGRIDAWLLEARRGFGNQSDVIEVTLAGPLDNRRVIEVKQTFGTREDGMKVPPRAALVAPLLAQYGLSDSGGDTFISARDPGGAELPPGGPRSQCGSPIAIQCGRYVFSVVTINPAGNGWSRLIRLNDPARARPILDASTPKSK